MKKVFVAFLALQVVLVLTIMAADPAGKGYDCEKAKRSLKSCMEYLTGNVDSPSAACCNGVKELKASAPTKDEKIAECQCIEEALTPIPNFKQDRAIALPKECGVDAGFPIPKNFTCSRSPPCLVELQLEKRKAMSSKVALPKTKAFVIYQYVRSPNITSPTNPAGKGYDCEKAKRSLKSCMEYLTGNVDSPSAACCNGVKELKASAPTKDEKIAECQCIEEALTPIPNFKQDRAIALPKECGVDVGFPIPKNFTCSSIS
ncbi:Non-specific lipid-transfer protein A [Glycine max]|nr:Non-specific lipid-transfer protein A [Glycine max]